MITRMVPRKQFVVMAGLTVLVVCCVVFSFSLFSGIFSEDTKLDISDPTIPLPPSKSILGQFRSAAVVSNGEPCAMIGKDILKKGGSAVDAAIATLLCDGVCCLHNMGIGGGFFMTIYNKESGKVETLNARESAPAAATTDMFNGNPKLSTIGGLSIAVPGELRGYQAVWERYGKLHWEELFQPTIKLCENGVPVNEHLAKTIEDKSEEIRKSETLSNLLVQDNGELPKVGDRIKMPRLAKTLKIVAQSPRMADEIYNGSLTDGLVKDIRSAGSILTVEDFASYRALWRPPIQAQLSGNLTIYSVPPPSSGLLLVFLMQLLDGFITEATSEVEVTQRITEAYKHAYGRRTDIADPDFYNISQVIGDLTSPEYIAKIRSKISDTSTSQDPLFYGGHYEMLEDHGTANIVVMAPNGDAVSVTSTVNLLFGSQFVSPSTGILLNDEMDDFSAPLITNYFDLPPSPANYITPGKRPLSSMCPSLVIDSTGNVRLAIGSAGGTKITTSTALVTILNLWFNKSIKEAIDYPRFHHQLMPMRFSYEYGLLKDVVDGMKRIGHKVSRMPKTWRSCVTAIARNGSMIMSNADFRRAGSSAGF